MSKHLFGGLAVLVLVAGAVAPAFGGEEARVEQQTCPVMGAPINPELYVDVDGYRLHVCCAACIAPIRQNPAKYVAKLREMGEEPRRLAEQEAAAVQDDEAGKPADKPAARGCCGRH